MEVNQSMLQLDSSKVRIVCLIGCFRTKLKAKAISWEEKVETYSYTFTKVGIFLLPTLHSHKVRMTGFWYSRKSTTAWNSQWYSQWIPRPGVSLVTSGSQVQNPNNYTMGNPRSLNRIKLCSGILCSFDSIAQVATIRFSMWKR